MGGREGKAQEADASGGTRGARRGVGACSDREGQGMGWERHLSSSRLASPAGDACGGGSADLAAPHAAAADADAVAVAEPAETRAAAPAPTAGTPPSGAKPVAAAAAAAAVKGG